MSSWPHIIPAMVPVHFSPGLVFGSAPASSRISTIRPWPRAAAHRNGVPPFSTLTFTSGPACTRACTTSEWPRKEAAVSATKHPSRTRGMDPTSGLLVEKEYPRFHKKENSCPLFAILPCSPAVRTHSNLRGYGRGLLAPELLRKTWRSYSLL